MSGILKDKFSIADIGEFLEMRAGTITPKLKAEKPNWNVQELIQLSYKLGLDMNLIARKSGSALKIIIISWMEKRGFTNDPAKAEFDRLMDKKISMEYLMESIDMKINRQIQKDYDNLLVKIRQQRDDGPEKIGGAAI